GDLAALGPKQRAVDADDIAEIEVREAPVRLLAQLVDLRKQLDPPAEILEMGERRFAHDPNRDQASGQRHALGPRPSPPESFGLLEERDRLGGTVRPIEAALVRLGTLGAEGLQLLTSLDLLIGPLGFHAAKV